MNKRGFTLIELLVVIAIIGLLSTIVMVSLNKARAKARDTKRVGDLRQIRNALEFYYDANERYPNSGGGWRSECPGWGGYAANDVIPGLVSAYMSAFPSDPTMNKPNNKCCYLYTSQGTQYAFLIHDCSEINYSSQPSLIDPKRDGGTDDCAVDGTNIWAWKISSGSEGRCW
jgi:prepilin-type N-terminal cleavage/methylation domain-containing protein